jgi:DNA-binding IclR family transcriptional regulator
MSRDKPVARAIKLLTLIERNSNGLRVRDMAEQLSAHQRAVYRDLEVLEDLHPSLVEEITDDLGRALKSYRNV